MERITHHTEAEMDLSVHGKQLNQHDRNEGNRARR